ncbi:putative lysophospholipase [Microsporum audouinii]
MASKAPYIVPAIKRHTATVIMAHGLGDTGAGWMMVAQNWRRRGLYDEVSFIFPNAPSIPITVNFGTSMPGWYDIKSLSSSLSMEEFFAQRDEAGILKSREYFNTLIKEEIDKGIKPSRIIFGGFSQGGAMALVTGLASPVKLGGIFGLSCYLPLSPEQLKKHIPDEWPNQKTPVFMGHGDVDQVVKFQYGQKTVDILEDMGVEVEFKEYPGLGHSGDPDEIEDLEKFLDRLIPDEGSSTSSEL